MTAMKQIGESKGLLHALRTGAATLALMAVSGYALASNVLQDVRYAAAPGGKVDITLQFSGPVGDVQAFTTDSPPRIAIDLPGTTNGMATRRVVVGTGATSAVSAAEAAGRTRVVVDLFRPAGYTTRSAGNLLVLTVDAGSPAASAGTAMANNGDPAKRMVSTLNVANIDFRRGDNGAGRVIMRFDGDGAATDMRNEGSRIVVDIGNANLPENLRKALSVADFATPVTTLEPKSNAGGTRLVINTNGSFESMAYQTGKEYIVEISPKRGSVIAGAPGGAMRSAGAIGGSVLGTQRYTGKAVTFNFQDVPVRTVLQLIAEESGLNVVVSDSVGGNLTLRLINVPWDQALDIILRAKSLDKRKDGNVVWVAPQKELSDYEQAREDARIGLELRAETVTEYIPVNYGNASDLAELLTDAKKAAGSSGGAGENRSRGILSPRGSVTFDTRTNTLIVTDIPKKIDEVKQLLALLDRPVDQVLIEARVVVADENFARDLGARIGLTDTHPNSNGNTTTSGFDINLPIAGAAGVFNLSILRSSSQLDLELSALETEGRGEILSNPRVITSNQREAIIKQGDEIGYVTTTNNNNGQTQQAQFKEALLELKVTPTITQDGRVYLTLAIKKDDVKAIEAGGVPSLSRREVSTAVLVDNGNTVVVGGVYEFKSRDDVNKVPWLGDVPFLGNLFKKRERGHTKAELLIFVTPRVLQTARR
ncbi:type IV pilus secretin PilQ [Arenimonas sp.]|uniref:type IV pilus secretin PilQ n=1 Tax=Arenimonas sp. TaxID=1872635 RepID=UPI0039E6644D